MVTQNRLKAWDLTRERWKLSLAFMLYMYFYLTAELAFIDCVEMTFDKNAGTVFYGLFCFAAAIGFFSFAPLRKIFRSTGSRRRVLFGVGMAGAVFTLLMPFVTGWVTGVISLVVMFNAGYIGAALLHSMAVSIPNKSAIGMFIAVPYATAFLLQYLLGLVEPLFGNTLLIATHVALAAALAASAILLLVSESGPEGEVAPRNVKRVDAKQFLMIALISCLIISCLYGLIDGIIMNLHAGQELDVWGWVRLLTIPGLLCAAWSFDYKGGKYFPFAALMAFMAEIIALFLFSAAETYSIALGLLYFFNSWMTMYSLGVFVGASRDADATDFWASAGRGVKYAMGGAFALVGGVLFARVSLVAIAIIYVALLVALACVFYFRGRLNVSGIDEQSVPDPPPPGKSFEGLVAAYGVTEREVEALRLLLIRKNTTEIAAVMFVTEGTVYKYISAMMSKTGVNNRAELIALFANPEA